MVILDVVAPGERAVRTLPAPALRAPFRPAMFAAAATAAAADSDAAAAVLAVTARRPPAAWRRGQLPKQARAKATSKATRASACVAALLGAAALCDPLYLQPFACLASQVRATAGNRAGAAPPAPQGASSRGSEDEGAAPGSAASDAAEILASVQFFKSAAARRAVELLDGSVLGMRAISVEMDPLATKGDRVLVFGLEYSETLHFDLHRHFEKKAGKVTYVNCGVVEVLFEKAPQSRKAVESFNGAIVDGRPIRVFQSWHPRDRKTVRIIGLPPSFPWAGIKEEFSRVGKVVSTSIPGTLGNQR